MKIGVCAGVEDAAKIEAAGYDFMEMTFDVLVPGGGEPEFVKLKEEMENYAVKVEAFNCFIPGEMKITGPEVDMGKLSTYVKAGMERAPQLGGEIVVFGSGGAREIAEGFPREKAQEQIAEFAKMAGEHAAANGITIAIEPLNKRECNVLNSIAETREMSDRVGHPAVLVLADICHMTVDGEPVEEIIKAGEKLAHVHIGEGDRSFPGDGDYDFQRLSDVLKEVGYDGRLSMECGWDDPDRDDKLVSSLEYVKKFIDS